mmetsp:Transcript_5209/g.5342  ORF Transcript_5209/g.5342 Transcript_5209/m.5342 type:complete len:238 (-) Transcript_5209:435-1148(-)
MIFSREKRFRNSRDKALCPCKCKIESPREPTPVTAVGAPKIAPGNRFRDSTINEQTVLYPKYEYFSPRSPAFSYHEGKRFRRQLFDSTGIDSPGPLAYSIQGPFEKLRNDRGRSFDKTTFGAAPRMKLFLKNQELIDAPLLDVVSSFKKTQEKNRGTALIVGKCLRTFESDAPGPGSYDINRNVLKGNAVAMKPPTTPRDSKGKRPGSAPGFYNLSKSLVRSSYNRGCEEPIKVIDV